MFLVRTGFLPLVLLGAAVASGCSTLATQSAQSPLRRPQMSPDSVGLDVVFVNCPFGDLQINESLWSEADEQHLPPALRQQLAQNGFRVGLISGQIPAPLAQLAKPGATPTPAGQWQSLDLDALDGGSKVTGHHWQARAGQRNEILVSGIYPELPVLVYSDGVVGGTRYPKAQGVFDLKVFPEPDGRVRLEVVPELQYGEARQQYVGDDNGVMRIESGRNRRIFDGMAFSTVLSPGQMLVLTSVPTRSGSLGHQFFTRQEGGKRQQRVLMIRVAQTQQQGLFSSAEPLDLAPLGH